MNRKWVFLLVMGLVCKDGYEKDKSAEVCVQVADAVKPSDEKPPRSGMPSWRNPRIHAVDLDNWTVAETKHPSTCAASCVWSGANCICNQDPGAGKKP